MKKNRILVVDDNIKIARALKMQLEHTGRFEVLAETSSRAALNAVRSFHPEMAILDVMMPGMDGGELNYQLHQIPELRLMPTLFLTAAKLQGERNDKELIIAKPVEISQIISLIDQQLNPAAQTTA